jgi:carbon starvation protein CstA
MLALPVISLLLFIAVFAMIVVRTMRRRPSQFDALAALPLDGAAEVTHGH